MGDRLRFLRWRQLATMRAALVLSAALASQVCAALLPPLNWGLVSRLVGPYDSVTDDWFWYIDPAVPDSDVTPTFTGYPVPDVE